MATFIPGYLGTITINAEDVSAYGNVVSLNVNKNVIMKPVFGSAWQSAIQGQKSGSLSASGHVDATDAAAMFTALDTADSVTFAVQVGNAPDTTDGGIFSGNLIVSAYSISASAEGEWDWSVEGTFDGAVAYAAPLPPLP